MSTLLIGGNGMIGTPLIKYLHDKGEHVVSYSSHPPAQKVDGCDYVQGDVTEYGTLNMVFKNHDIQRVIHNAAVSNHLLYRDNPYKVYRVNVIGTLTALEAARNYGVERFVFISSCGAYGPIESDIVAETQPLVADGPYGASKVAGEALVKNYGLDTVSLRLGFVYGPGRWHACPIKDILAEALSKGFVTWNTGMDTILDYIYIDDCVKAIADISFAKSYPHLEYNIGGGERVPYTRIVDRVRQLLPGIDIKVGPGQMGYAPMGALSIQRARDDFGWYPRVTIEQGIGQYLEWLRDQ